MFSKFQENEVASWFEVPASGIYVSKISNQGSTSYLSDIKLYPWVAEFTAGDSTLAFPISIEHPLIDSWKVSQQKSISDTSCSSLAETASLFNKILSDAVRKRIVLGPSKCLVCSRTLIDDERIDVGSSTGCTHATLGVLFSGGLDSTVLAALADQYVYSLFLNF